MVRTIILEVARLTIIVVFCYAAVSKLLDFPRFTIQVSQSPLLTGFGDVIPATVIASEMIVCVLLVMNRTRLAGFCLAYTIMVAFTAYIIVILNFSPFIPCSCGGILEKLNWNEHLIFNVVLTAFALTAMVLQTRMTPKHLI
ncbi:MAG TPA: MauE/DoxX family redox-associated membrane protein [Chryseosolibacter sp.]